MPAHIKVWDVEHGACAMLWHDSSDKLAMIDSGDNVSEGWKPSTYIKNVLKRTVLDYLTITNADQDHMSDLAGLSKAGITVSNLCRNPSPDGATLRKIKQQGGPLSDDIEKFLEMHERYNQPTVQPFDKHMGGITRSVFYNSHPQFSDTNNLSLAAFIDYAGFRMLFPGDLEKAGWLALLKNAAFVEKLKGTTVLCASHHGRESGYCEEIFEHFAPKVVVISDKPIKHDTQLMVPDYSCVIPDKGVLIRNTGKQRHVLTTRRDGHIEFTIYDDGSFDIDTECRG